MKERWKSRIKVIGRGKETYDVLGHLEKREEHVLDERWAYVCPNLSEPITAAVTVRLPFNYGHNILIEWADKRWRVVQGPMEFSNVGLAKFRMEEIA